MNTAPELAGIYVAGLDPAPKPPKMPNWFEKLANLIFNWVRKPLVALRSRELLRIASSLKYDLQSLITHLESLGHTCPICRFNAMNLKAEVFTSTMRRILTTGRCKHHEGSYIEFEAKHRDDFDRSEKLSRWINGF